MSRERIAPDSAWGRYYARKGLALTQSTRAPLPHERLASWLAKQALLPPELRRVRA